MMAAMARCPDTMTANHGYEEPRGPGRAQTDGGAERTRDCAADR
jgi:hypothetical protein